MWDRDPGEHGFKGSERGEYIRWNRRDRFHGRNRRCQGQELLKLLAGSFKVCSKRGEGPHIGRRLCETTVTLTGSCRCLQLYYEIQDRRDVSLGAFTLLGDALELLQFLPDEFTQLLEIPWRTAHRAEFAFDLVERYLEKAFARHAALDGGILAKSFELLNDIGAAFPLFGSCPALQEFSQPREISKRLRLWNRLNTFFLSDRF